MFHGSHHSRVSSSCICVLGIRLNWNVSSVVGRNGADLAKKWADHAEALQGILVDDFPNYVSMGEVDFCGYSGRSWLICGSRMLFCAETVGPASPVAQGSIISVIEMQGHWVSMMLDIIQKSRIK